MPDNLTPMCQRSAVAFVLTTMLCAADAAHAGAEGPTTPGLTISEIQAMLGGPAAEQESPPVDSLIEALAQGRFHTDVRLRLEIVDDSIPNATGARRGWGRALTNRTRFGYATAQWQGLSAYVELENIAAVDSGDYDPSPAAPLGLPDHPSQAVVADPYGTELNQAFGMYRNDWVQFIAGRQRIILDDSRFIGNVGWRQDEQTFDGGQLRLVGIKDLVVTYAYLAQINRIFIDSADFDADAHLINAAWTSEFGKLVGFIYLLDFQADNFGGQGETYGLRYTHDLAVCGKDQLKLAGSFAHTTDAGVGDMFEADYYAIDLGYVHHATGITAGVGLEVLASDDGLYGFQTPLATGHKFNGWADRFLTTPANGLRDAYTYIGATLPFDVQGKIVYHHFFGDDATVEYGDEIDMVLSRKLNEHLSVTAKFAHYNGNGTVSATSPDTGTSANDATRFWLQLDLTF